MRFHDYTATLRYPNGDLVLQPIRARMQADAYDMAETLSQMSGAELLYLERVEDQYKEDLQLEALYEERYELGD